MTCIENIEKYIPCPVKRQMANEAGTAAYVEYWKKQKTRKRSMQREKALVLEQQLEEI